MANFEREHWETLYSAALLELDRGKLPQVLRIAQDALRDRLAYLNQGSDHAEERRAIADALQNLRVLRESELSEEKNYGSDL